MKTRTLALWTGLAAPLAFGKVDGAERISIENQTFADGELSGPGGGDGNDSGVSGKRRDFTKTTMRTLIGILTLCTCLGAAASANANTTVRVVADEEWLGYMNVFERPENGGGFAFGSPWGTADLRATFSDSALTLAPNTIGDPAPFWYVGGGGPGSPGDKIMAASMYVEPPGGALAGQSVTFAGTVLENTLTEAHEVTVFIKDFAPDYSSFNVTSAPLVNGEFSIILETLDDPARHVQYGFEMVGVNVWATDAEPFGTVRVTAAATDPYSDWIAGFDFAAFDDPDLSAVGDPEGDGMNNRTEFALDGDPVGGAAGGKVRSRVEEVEGEAALLLTFPVRGTPVFGGSPGKTATADQIAYIVEGSDTLADFDQEVTEVTPARSADMPELNSGWTYRTFRLAGPVEGPGSRGAQGFLRVRFPDEP